MAGTSRCTRCRRRDSASPTSRGRAPNTPQRGLEIIIKRLGAREVRSDTRRRGSVKPTDQPGGFMNQLTPYAAFFMRLAVGGVFLHHA